MPVSEEKEDDDDDPKPACVHIFEEGPKYLYGVFGGGGGAATWDVKYERTDQTEGVLYAMLICVNLFMSWSSPPTLFGNDKTLDDFSYLILSTSPTVVKGDNCSQQVRTVQDPETP